MNPCNLYATNFAGNQDAITLAHITTMATALSSNNAIDPQFIMGCNPAWTITKGAYITQGFRMHGDSAPWWWADDLTNPGTALTRYWNAINAWGVIFTDATNTNTNAFFSIYDVQLYVLYTSTGVWTRIDGSDGRPAYANLYYPLDNFTGGVASTFTYDPVTSYRGWNCVPTAGDRTLAATIPGDEGKFRIAHNALIPSVQVDGSDVGGVFVTFKVRMFTADGAALNGTPIYYAQAGSDIKPELTSALNTGELAGALYYPGVGASNLIEIPTNGSSVRVSFCTVGGSGFSTNVSGADDSIYGASNNPYLSYAEIAAKLPILKFNDSV